MSPLFYILRKQIKNIIRGLAYKPMALIGYILLGLFFLGFLVLVLIMPSGAVHHASNELFQAAFTALITMALYFSLRQGIEKGSTYFRLSDVNLVFPAPFKPSSVLLYGFIKHMGTTLLIVVFTVFQIPNIKNNFILQDYGIWVILLAVLLYSLLYPILGMILYTFASVSRERRNRTKRGLDALLLLFVVGLFLQFIKTKSIPEALMLFLGSDIFKWMPLIGQLRTIACAAVYGFSPYFYISIFILTGFIAAFVTILYKTDLDYYEDVLAATERSEQRIKAKRAGRDNSIQERKTRKIKGGFSTGGARAIFEKNLLEYRKTSYFMFFDKSSLFIILFTVVFRYIMPSGQQSIFFTLFMSVYMLFFFIVQGKWPMELDKPYVFLIPESTGKKLFYTTLTENIKNLLDGILLFVISAFIYKSNPLVILFCIISYTLYGAVFIYGDIVSRRLFGKVHSKVMQIFAKLFISFVVVIPGIVLMLIAFFALESEVIASMIIMVWNLLVVLGLFFAAKGIFNNLETA